MSEWSREKELHVDVVDNVPKRMPKFMEKRVIRPLKDSNHNHCICERPMSRLLCTNCKETYLGRISRTCTMHPNVKLIELKISDHQTNKFFLSIIPIGSLLAGHQIVLQVQLENAHRNRRGNSDQHESNETLSNSVLALPSGMMKPHAFLNDLNQYSSQNHKFEKIQLTNVSVVFSLNIYSKCMANEVSDVLVVVVERFFFQMRRTH